MTALIEMKDLAIRTHERFLVDGVDMVVQPSRVTALIGPSGAGKSLTARCSMGVIDVSPGLVRGELRYPAIDANKDWFAGIRGGGSAAHALLLEQTRALRGAYFTYSPQAASSALNPGRTVGRQLELAIQRRSVQPSDMGVEIGNILSDVGLRPEVASALPGALSGGMAQRAALAIAVAPKPKLVIADEPETGLDPVLRRTVIELLVEVCKGHGAGLLLISHHEDTVERIADDVVRLPGVLT
jgi:ABC-type glutathione transport system ATPase component